jgi:hypothetical protein
MGWVAVVAIVVGGPGEASGQHEQAGSGKRGKWRIVWSLAEADSGRSVFHDRVGEDVEFPFLSRRVDDAGGPRLVFFDGEGQVAETVRFGPGEDGIASADASVYILWTVDPAAAHLRNFRFFRRGIETPDWEVTARGDPVLIAGDGSLFLVAERAKGVDRFQRVELYAGGSLQVVGAGGEVRGELPIYPSYARFTGDERRIAILHDEELVVLGRDGRLEWDRAVPIDEIAPRDGLSQLETAGGVIVVAGTGTREDESGESSFQLHATRLGAVAAYTDAGRRLWRHEQPDGEEYWFQVSAAISVDGSVVATCHSSRREIVVRLYEAQSGELLWTRTARRGTGFRSLSVAPGGGMTVLVHGSTTTDVTAWDREGSVVWEGYLPVQGKVATIGRHDLLLFDRWIVELTPDSSE